ncbi:MAG: hypothetical protein GDA53_01210 [Rhodobacteraceae bacterium]|nr:hypothetical protein [Paracoccaceae bacterium]
MTCVWRVMSIRVVVGLGFTAIGAGIAGMLTDVLGLTPAFVTTASGGGLLMFVFSRATHRQMAPGPLKRFAAILTFSSDTTNVRLFCF